jgi:hypothetical protein
MQLTNIHSRPHITGRRKLYWNSRWCKAIAAVEREGRIQKQIRRRFVAAGGKPLRSPDFLPWAYPKLSKYQGWHRWSVRRALLKYAIPIGRSGHATLWAPRN